MDVAAAGGLILFFSLLVGLILVALGSLCLRGLFFLVVLSNTAVATIEVIWPEIRCRIGSSKAGTWAGSWRSGPCR